MRKSEPKIGAFWLLLIAIPAAAPVTGLAEVSYWSVPRFALRPEGDSLISYDPEMGFVPTPNTNTTVTQMGIGTYHVYTDRRGARVSSPEDQSPDKLDMLFIGDSFTWGHGVEMTIPMPRLWRVAFHLASANLAMASYGTTQALQMLRRNLDFRPRTMIYPIVTDHWRRNVSACAPTYYPFCLDCSYVTIGANGLPAIRAPATNIVRRTTLQIQYEKKGLPLTQWVVHGADVILGRVLLRASQEKSRGPSPANGGDGFPAYRDGQNHARGRRVSRPRLHPGQRRDVVRT